MQIWVLSLNKETVAYINKPTVEDIISATNAHGIYEYPYNEVSQATVNRILTQGHAVFYGRGTCVLHKVQLSQAELLCNSQFNNYLSQGS